MKVKTIIIISASVVSTVIIALLMKIFGKYSNQSIFLTLFIILLVVAFVYLAYWYFFIKKKLTEDKEFTITPEEAKLLGKDKLLKEDGILLGEEEISTVRSVGEGQNKEPYFLWVIRDRLNRNIRVAYFRNLKKIQIESKIIDKTNEFGFIDRVIGEMNATVIPFKEPNKYIRIRRDPTTGEEVYREEGVSPNTIVQEDKKDTIEVKEG